MEVGLPDTNGSRKCVTLSCSHLHGRPRRRRGQAAKPSERVVMYFALQSIYPWRGRVNNIRSHVRPGPCASGYGCLCWGHGDTARRSPSGRGIRRADLPVHGPGGAAHVSRAQGHEPRQPLLTAQDRVRSGHAPTRNSRRTGRPRPRGPRLRRPAPDLAGPACGPLRRFLPDRPYHLPRPGRKRGDLPFSVLALCETLGHIPYKRTGHTGRESGAIRPALSRPPERSGP